MALTVKQQKFADEYIIDLNARQAAIRAGYSEKSADQQGSTLLSNPKVRKYIDERLAAKENETIAKQDEILKYLTSVMRGQETEETPIAVGKGRQKLLPKGTTVKDRVRAAELLGRRYGIWVDNTNISGNIGVTIIDDIGGGSDETD